MRIHLFTLCCIVPFLLQGQTVITSSDLLAMIGSEHSLEMESRASFPVNVGSSGPNQTWDYRSTSIPNPLKSINTFLVPVGTPFDTAFPQANMAHRIIDSTGTFTQYNYYQINPANFTTLGSGSILGPPLDTFFVNRDVNNVGPLPLTYGTTWMSVQVDTTGSFPAFANVSIDTMYNRIDAWGTVRLMVGDFACLRIRQDFKFINITIIGGNVVSTSVETGIQYNWVARNAFLVASIQSQDGETDSNFTNGRGFSRIVSMSTSVEPISDNLPSVSRLYQNYPNPFNPSTIIEYSVGETGNVLLVLFDMLGREVSTIVAGHHVPGEYRTTFTPDPSLASGVYLYRLETTSGTLTQRMMLLR